MFYVLGALIITVIAYITGKQHGAAASLLSSINNDDDKRFIAAAYESGRSTQQMFIVQDVGEPYVSTSVDEGVACRAREAKARMLNRNSKVLQQNLLLHLRTVEQPIPVSVSCEPQPI